MIRVFRLQILLDRIDGETVDPEEMANALNKVIPENHFYALGERWKEARDSFRDQLEKGKVSVAPGFDYNKAFSKITYSTPWEDYPPEARSLIGSSIAQSFDKRNGTTIITAPLNSKILKPKVFEIAVSTMMGKSNDYLHTKDCIYCNYSLIKDYVLGIRGNFIVLADKYPVIEGHILIIPMLRVRAIGDLPIEHLLEIDNIITEVSDFYSIQNKKLILFEPGFIGQSVYHAHIHCIPGDFVISEGLQALGEEVQELSSIDMIGKFYKENGGYFMWGNGIEMYTCAIKKEVPAQFFRSLIAGQLFDGSIVNWKNYEGNKELMSKSKIMVDQLINEWKNYVKG
jgi:diadenosine tetraphosphate (Ap4A) HIT family hydrolase